MAIAGKKVRVQVDLSEKEATLINHLVERLSVRSRADLLQQAYGTFLWVLTERLSGNRILSVDSENAAKLDRYKELSIPAAEPLLFDHYEHLVVRPESNYRQAYLRGRNMRVGQLIYYLDDCAFSYRLREMLIEAGHNVQIPADVEPPLTGAKDHLHIEHAS